MTTNIQTKMTIIVGTNGTGKTTELRRMLTAITNPDRKLIVTRHLFEWSDFKENKLISPADFTFKGINYHIPADPSLTLSKIQHLKNSVVVFDDARKYLKAKTEEELNDLYISRRQYAIHIFFVAHNFKQVPVQAFGFATNFILFKTVAAIDNERLNQLNDPEKFLETKRRVDLMAEKNPFYKELITL